MKLTTSYVPPPGVLVRPLALLMWGGACIGFALLPMLLWEMQRLEQSIPAVESELRAMQKLRTTLIAEAVPDPVRLQRLQVRAAYLQKLAGAERASPRSVLKKLAEVIPSAVSLRELRHDSRTGQTVLTAESWSQAPLTGFLDALEREGGFEEVRLVRATRRQITESNSLHEFEFRLSGRSP